MLDYHLGAMKDKEGTSLRYDVESKAADYAVHISKSIKTTPAFRELARKLKSPRPLLYFQWQIKKEQTIACHCTEGLEVDRRNDLNWYAGIGITNLTTAIKAAITGCKAVFYDILSFKKHELYRWGYERLVFDDLRKRRK